MCGIFGYVGPRDGLQISIEGLRRLEYRGYDSSGVAALERGQLRLCKCVGKISNLEQLLEEKQQECRWAASTVVAHTRWATHGPPSKENAHPHTDLQERLAVVHNGIVENYEPLRDSLISQGVAFRSETDSEVVAHLVSSFYDGDLLRAVQRVIPLLRGSFAIAFTHANHPDQIIVAAKEAPLAIGIGNGESFIASDATAFARHTRNVLYLAHSEVAIVRPRGYQLYDAQSLAVERSVQTLAAGAYDVSKGNYEHYTLKEIFEQPQTIRTALLARVSEEYGTAYLDGLAFDVDFLLRVRRIVIVACGTSYHAGLIAARFIEEMARIPVQVEVASEFRYGNPIVEKDTLAIAISQSGETADTLAALRELKAKGAPVIGICNVQMSSIVRESDCALFLRAGPEIGVCSTKAFVSSLIVLFLFALYMARMRDLSKPSGQRYIKALLRLPDQVQQILDRAAEIRALATKYASYNNFFYLGRHYMYPVCMEGALKLKEISYINANGYAAGEMKHGPIALIGPDCPTVAFCADSVILEKMVSNMREVKARSGRILAVVEEGVDGLENVVDDLFSIPRTLGGLSCVPAVVFGQLFAYYVAHERCTEIDQPRNLAKSVTVE